MTMLDFCLLLLSLGL